MAKVKIKHPNTGIIYTADTENLTDIDKQRLNMVEEKPKRKKYKNVKQEKDVSKVGNGTSDGVQETSEEGTKED